ncbi:MAG TPA: AI-2E family transporter [Blastococcus sp.]|nr:AI-2E family transporter [Blastococcus sp.]
METAAAWSWRALVIGFLGYVVVSLLARLSLVTVPLAVAVLLSALLHRPAAFLRRFLPRGVAALVVVLGGLVIVGGLGYVLVGRVQAQAGDLVVQAQDVLTRLRGHLTTLPGVGTSSGTVVDRLNGWLHSHSAAVVNGAFSVGVVAVDLLTGFALTVFLTLFLVSDGERMWAWLVRLLPARSRQATNGAGHRAYAVLTSWITGTTVIALIHAVVIGATLWWLGTPLTIVLAVLVFAGSFIPILGALVFGGLAVLVTLLTVGPAAAVVLVAVLVVEDLLEGHVYQPFIMGRSLRLHPVVILLVLSAGAVLGGVVGALVAVPLTASATAAVKYLAGLEDIHGEPLTAEDRMRPQPPPERLRPRHPARADPRAVPGSNG